MRGWGSLAQLLGHHYAIDIFILFQTSMMVGIFIGNLVKGGVAVVTESDLKPLFELYGTVEKVQIKTKGFGWVILLVTTIPLDLSFLPQVCSHA